MCSWSPSAVSTRRLASRFNRDMEAAPGAWDAHFWIQARLWDILKQIIGRDRRHRPPVLALSMNTVALSEKACTLAPGSSQGCCEQVKGSQPTHRSYKLTSFWSKSLTKTKELVLVLLCALCGLMRWTQPIEHIPIIEIRIKLSL